jgi:Na+/proline symporter
MIAALYFKNINHFGAIAGICVGAGLAGFWPLLNCPIPTLVGAMGASFISMYLVSKLTSSK